MKEYYFKRTGKHSPCWVKLICDKCKRIITDTTEYDFNNRNLSEKYRDLNWGHECDSCRKSRRRAYDIYVTSFR